MKYNQLDNLGEISAVALGAWQFAGGGTWGPVNDHDSIQTVEAALEAGINLIDTAEKYGAGRSETVIGKALTGKRRQVIIATKAAQDHLTRSAIIKACEGSLRRLRTDYIDLYQLHWPNHKVEPDETAEGLRQLVKDGKIRAAGVCNYGPMDLQELMKEIPLVSNQMCYSLLFRAVEHDLLPLCRRAGIGLLCYSPLMMGLLSGKYYTLDDFAKETGRARSRLFSADRGGRHSGSGYEAQTTAALARLRTICEQFGEPMPVVSLAWLLHQPGVTSVLAGSRTPEQIRENARTGGIELPQDMTNRITEATEELKDDMGTNLEIMRSQEDSRIR